MIDVDTLRSVLDYNPGTGVFVWKVRPSARTFAGDLAGNLTAGGYREVKFRRKSYLAHRLAWLYVYGVWPLETIDHINGNRLDNRIENLRDVTLSQNCQNKHRAKRTSRTGLRGVSITDKRSKFRAAITVSGKIKNIGNFDSPEEAHEAYMKHKRIHHISQPTGVDYVLGS